MPTCADMLCEQLHLLNGKLISDEVYSNNRTFGGAGHDPDDSLPLSSRWGYSDIINQDELYFKNPPLELAVRFSTSIPPSPN